jgi:type II secretory ATPase GspE/PulE/Tfp pilus assembly ATPase PilB-like protein
MRAFLRADPDIIMVGESRDKETVSMGVEASLTGHLVFSTLHTNSAPESITRLLDMGMDPFNFADALLGILAQRLAKRLCDCKEAYTPDAETSSRRSWPSMPRICGTPRPGKPTMQGEAKKLYESWVKPMATADSSASTARGLRQMRQDGLQGPDRPARASDCRRRTSRS